MGFVYKIINKKNNKMYIGKTNYTIEDRFKEHIKDSKRYLDRPLYRAFNKYGIENFIIEKIGEYPEEQLNEMEQY